MGTRIYVTVEHSVTNYGDRAATMQVLAPTIPAALAVADYWRSVDPGDTESRRTWEPFPANPAHGLLHYQGPGSLYIEFGARVAVISTGGRWRGFLSIEPLRRVHLSAFREIARILGARRMAFFPSEGIADDLRPAVIDDGISQDDCLAMLRRCYGPAQPSVEDIAPDIIAETEHCAPSVWYLEELETKENGIQRISIKSTQA